jgi:hypothetical protein
VLRAFCGDIDPLENRKSHLSALFLIQARFCGDFQKAKDADSTLSGVVGAFFLFHNETKRFPSKEAFMAKLHFF